MSVREGWLTRSMLLKLGNVPASRFRVMVHRNQLPARKLWNGDHDSYAPFLPLVLVVADAVAEHTPMSREEFGKIGDTHLPRMMGAYSKTLRGEGGWIAMVRTSRNTELVYGTREDILAQADKLALENGELEAISLVNMTGLFSDLAARAERMGVKIVPDEG